MPGICSSFFGQMSWKTLPLVGTNAALCQAVIGQSPDGSRLVTGLMMTLRRALVGESMRLRRADARHYAAICMRYDGH